ncbi:MAG TPA: hypothetical protein VFZ47_03290 [Chitinophagaceae bacterium]
MPRLYLILLFIIYNEEISAQVVRPGIDIFNAGAYYESFTDALTAATQPAALAFCRSFTAGIYGENRFLLQGVQHFMISAVLPVANDGAGVQVCHFKTPAYSHTSAGMGYAKTLGWAILGIRFHYNNIIVPGYSPVNGLDVEAGSNCRLTDQLRLGMCVYLPAGNKWRSAYRYLMGLGYKISDQLLMVLETGKEENKPAGVHVGIYYRPTQRWTLQLGINTANAQPYLCTGFQSGNWRILVTVIHSVQLGPSPGLALILPPTTGSL